MVCIAVFFVAWSISAFAIALFHSATAFCALASDSIRFDPVIPSLMVLILFSISRFFASHLALFYSGPAVFPASASAFAASAWFSIV